MLKAPFNQLTTQMAETDEITVGYWAIRGLAAPLRMMVMFAGRPLKSVHYECVSNVEKNGFDHSAWFSVKDQLKAENPLVNLPYVQVGNGPLVAQSNACFQYLGRTLGLMGDSDMEYCQVEQLLCEAMDLRNSIIRFAYSRAPAELTQWLERTVDLVGNTSCAKLELWLRKKYTDENLAAVSGVFFVGNRASAADFHIWELLDQLVRMAAFSRVQDQPAEGLSDGKFVLEQTPFLFAFYQRFASLEQNQRYFASPLSRELPVNNPSASGFGATPSGHVWSHTMNKEDMTWLGLSGRY